MNAGRIRAGRSRSYAIEKLLAALAVVVAIWILLSSIQIARTGWIALPITDDWDRWITYVHDHYTPGWFWQQHVDHRLAVPRVLFAVDHLFFRARGWFLLVCAFCFQALTGIMLWWLSGKAYRQERVERVLLGALIAACVFSGQQWLNLIWPFQVQFPLVYLAVTATMLALWQGAARNWPSLWTAIIIVLATVATYSMANGVLLWPLLLVAGVWLRMPRRHLAAIAASTVLLGATYFYHWHRGYVPPVVMTPEQRLSHAIIFGFAHLGSPMSPLAMLADTDATRLAIAAIPGVFLGLALTAGCIMLWRHRERYSTGQA